MPTKLKNGEKCKEWERRRRDKLNDAFKNLAQLLPHYDPASIPAKIDILEKSTEFVKELRLSNSRLVSKQAENDEKCKLIKELQDEVNRLILRVKQLTVLLRKANITIPIGPAIHSLGSKRHKWSDKLKPEDVENSRVQNGISTSDKTNSPLLDKGPAGNGVNGESGGKSINSPSPIVSESTTFNPSNPVSIIVPLKETNLSKVAGNIKPGEACATATSLPPCSPQTTTISSPTGTTTVTVTMSSPSFSINPPQTFATTSPLQLPLQTFIITPCPIGSTTMGGQPPQILTRITLPSPIMPKPLDGMSFQKIAIKSVLKPIPKVIKRRRKRTKVIKDSVETTPPPGVEDKSASKFQEHLQKPPETNSSASSVLETSSENEAFLEKGDLSSETEIATAEVPSPIAEVTISNTEVENEDTSEKELAVSKIQAEDTVISSESGNKHSRSTEEGSEKVSIQSKTETDSPEMLDKSETEDPKAIAIVSNVSISQQENQNDIIEENIPVLRIIESTNDSDTTFVSKIVLEQHEEPSLALLETGPTAEKGTDPHLQDITMDREAIPEVAVVSVLENKEATKENPICDSDKPTCQAMDVTEYTGPTKVSKPTMDISPDKVDTIQRKGKQMDESKEKRNDKDMTVGVPLSQNDVEPNHIVEMNALEQTSNSSAEENTMEVGTTLIAEATSTPSVSATEITQIDSPMAVDETPSISLIETSTSSETIISTSSKQSMLNGAIMNTSENDTVTTDKISECIARSIDLIDANDSELMELGEHWESSGASPKSPISPTQMFLNIFPLLPRESSGIHAHESQQQLHSSLPQPTQTAVTPHKNPPVSFPNSSNRSSFFIDAMLPDEQSSNTQGTQGTLSDGIDTITSSTVPQSHCLALTPPQFSSSISSQQVPSTFSMSNSYYWNTTACSSTSNVMEYRGSQHQEDQRNYNPPTTSSSVPISKIFTPSTSSIPSISASASSTLVTPTSINKSSKSKATKMATSSKQSQESFNTFTRNKSAPVITTSTVASTTVTWSITAPTQTDSLAQQPSSNSLIQLTPLPHSSSSGSTSNSQAQLPPCSLLDSLNSMDASFFRPLINAIDTHDFRALEFPTSNTRPPPAPPLPPLIPPTQPLYNPQFNPVPTGSQTAHPSQYSSVGYHVPALSSNEQHNISSIQNTMLHHRPPRPPPIFSNNTNINISSSTQQSSTNTSNIPNKRQHLQQTTPSSSLSQMPSTKHQTSGASSVKRIASNASSEKTSRNNKESSKTSTSKSETYKQSRSGKSSRTQPYIVPSSCSHSGNTSQRQEHFTSASQNPHSTSNLFQISQYANSSIATPNKTSNSFRNYNFQVPATPSSCYQVDNQVPQHYSSNSTVQQAHAPKQTSIKSSSPGTKSQKSKEAKSRSYQNLPPPTSSSHSTIPVTTQTTSHNVDSLYTSSTTSSASSAAQITLQPAYHTSSKSSSSLNAPSKANFPQSFPFHPVPASESSQPFQLFPDFSASGQRHTANQYESTSMSQNPSQQTQLSTPAQKPHYHPYYLPDNVSSTFENFSAPHMPQHALHQVNGNSNSNRQTQTNNSIVHQSSNANSKYMYGQGHDSNTSSSLVVNPSSSHSGSANIGAKVCPSHAQQSQSQISHPHQQHPNVHRDIHFNQQHSLHIVPHSQQSATIAPNISQQPPNNEPCQQIQQRNRSQTQTQQQHQSSPVVVSSKNKPAQHIPFQTSHTSHSFNQQSQQHNVPVQQQQQSNRSSSSRTVNWMTDTSYMTNNSNSANANAANKQKQHPCGTGNANNPFSVSKLVGANPTAGRNQVTSVAEKSREQPQTPSAANNISMINTTAVNKTTTSNANTGGGGSARGQSSYCAEALIRKNPDWNTFNAGAPANPPSNFPGYMPSNSSSSTHNPEHYTNYSNLPMQYPHHSASVHVPPSSGNPHFTHLETPSQNYHAPHHHQHQAQPPTYQPPSQHQTQNIFPQPNQSSQMHYPQHHHPHHHHHSHQQPNPHQSHSSSTSSVSNFNLSTIFPEINDKRNSSNNTNANQGGSTSSGGSNSGGVGTGNIGSCNYHHSGFGNS